jgi:hypothetical protein
MANRREYNRVHGHRQSPESRKKSNRKYRISSYGLTQEQFDRLLAVQQHACGMCHEPFEEGQLVHVDHDHTCWPGKNRSCGECIRGLLALEDIADLVGHKGTATTETVYRKVIVPELRRGAEIMDRLFS